MFLRIGHNRLTRIVEWCSVHREVSALPACEDRPIARNVRNEIEEAFGQLVSINQVSLRNRNLLEAGIHRGQEFSAWETGSR